MAIYLYGEKQAKTILIEGSTQYWEQWSVNWVQLIKIFLPGKHAFQAQFLPARIPQGLTQRPVHAFQVLQDPKACVTVLVTEPILVFNRSNIYTQLPSSSLHYFVGSNLRITKK